MMSPILYSTLDDNLKLWSQNKHYPIGDIEKLMASFILALTQVYETHEIQNQTATQEEYVNIYNKIMLNPIFDSHPLEFFWQDDPKGFLMDITSLISLAHDVFETIETKNAYLISLGVAFKKSAPKTIDQSILEKASEMIYESIFEIENPIFDKSSKKEKIEDDYSHLADGQALAFQIHYHRWMILNKSTLPETSYMRNRFINIVIRKNFPKHTPNPESKLETSYASSHKKLKSELTEHMTAGAIDTQTEKLNQWINSFTNNVMLVYYGFYKWDKLRGDFYKVIDLEKAQFGIKLPDQFDENQKEFNKFIDISN
tara:strand:- start:3573 stop:4514 length:942 start_codon:yes stop_codon:yes gene_type:complete